MGNSMLANSFGAFQVQCRMVDHKLSIMFSRKIRAFMDIHVQPNLELSVMISRNSVLINEPALTLELPISKLDCC